MEAIGTFGWRIAHDFNNILAAILVMPSLPAWIFRRIPKPRRICRIRSSPPIGPKTWYSRSWLSAARRSRNEGDGYSAHYERGSQVFTGILAIHDRNPTGDGREFGDDRGGSDPDPSGVDKPMHECVPGDGWSGRGVRVFLNKIDLD